MGATPEDAKQRIIDYYVAATEESYLPNWAGESLGFHFGLADETTQSLAESLLNTNEYLASCADVRAGMRVLDAGCGVGGSAIWLAERLKARVTGVTLVARQVELGRRFADEHNVSDLVDFEQADMLATSFGQATFDVVWNIESVCHVVDLTAYIEHVAFLLKDGGRFACIDLCSGFDSDERDASIEQQVCAGWALAALRPPREIADTLVKAGFTDIRVVDLTARAMRSAQALEAMASRSLLRLRAEQAFLGQSSPQYEAHVRAALAMVNGMTAQKTSVVHFSARRPPR
jgi:cyclopropane fatty-acyl-phospholipid synthase-like methyltransferase